MANNVFQVKRTSTTGRTPNTTASYATNSQYIAAGEFALNMADGILYTSNGSTVITVGSNLVNQRITNSLTLDNDRNLNFKTVNTSATVGFRQQSDDNFVFYSTNTTYGQRAVWAIFANSDTSALSILTPITFNSNVNQIVANGSLGTAGQVLASNGSGIYWTTSGGTGTVTSVGSGSGLTGGPITGSGSLSVLANNGITANSTGTFVTQGTGVVVNATGVHVNAAYINTIAANSATFVLANNGIISNSTGVFVNGNTGIVVNSTGVFVNATYIGTISSNNASFLGGTAAASYQLNSTLNANIASYLPTYNGVVNASSFNAGATGTGTGGSVQNTTTMFVGNNTINTSISAGAITINGTAVIANNSGLFTTGTVNAASHTTGATGTGTGGISANVTTLWIGNNNINTTITSAGLVVNGTAVIANNSGVYATGTVNAASHTVGAVFVANTTTLNANGVVVNSTGGYFTGLVNSTSHTSGAIGTGTGGTVQNTTTMFVGNNTTNVSISASGLVVNGTAVVANNTGVWTTGTVNAASHTTGATGTGTGGAVVNTTVFFLGNNTINAAVNTTSLYIGGNVIANSTGANNAFNLGGVAAASYVNTSGAYTITGIHTHTANLVVNAAIIAGGTSGSAGQVLTSNGTGNVYWSTVTSGGVNTAASYTWTNVQIFTANVTVNGAIIAGGNSGTAGQLLASNGTGNVYWTDAPVSNAVYMKGGAAAIGTLAAGGSNIFRVNANTLNYNTTISTGENAQATGPLAVASGITLTVESGARVAIV